MEMAAGKGTVRQRLQQRPAAAAVGFGQCTPVHKGTTGASCARHRWPARQRRWQAGLGQPRNRCQQAAGVGVCRRQQDLARGTRQHHFAGIQNHHAVTDAGNGAQIVADIDHGRAGLLVDVAQQGQDVRLRRHIQPGGGLVKQQHVGLAGQRHGDGHPLLLAA